jgi:hypothetical protein
VRLPVKVDGSPKHSPFDFWSVVHLLRTIGVDAPRVKDGLVYDFVSWSDGGRQFHNISAPATETGYIAHFWKRPGYGSITANPNPIVVPDGSGTGATTLSWTSRQTSNVEVAGRSQDHSCAVVRVAFRTQRTTRLRRHKIFLQDVTPAAFPLYRFVTSRF